MKYYKRIEDVKYSHEFNDYYQKGKIYEGSHKRPGASLQLQECVSELIEEVPAGDYFVQENRLPENYVVKCSNSKESSMVLNSNTKNSKKWCWWKYCYTDKQDPTGFRITNDIKNISEEYPLFTFEQWDKIVNKNVIEEFKLPEKWCVKPSKETSEWFNKNSQTNARDYHTMKYGYFHYPKVAKYFHHWDTIQSGYTEITFDQFKKYVLNQEVIKEKKITGYKLKEGYEHYRKAAEEITGFRNPSNSEEYFTEFFKKKLLLNETFINRLKEAGVLDLWFEPVYKTEIPDIEIGDYIYIIDACGAHKEHLSEYNGDILKVTSFEKENFHLCPNAYWLKHTPKSFSGGGFRVDKSAWEYGVHFRKATKEEILKYLQAEFTKKTGVYVGSNVQEISKIEIISYGKVKEFFLHIRGKEKGDYSTYTENWFEDNPNEKYQLGIKLKNLGVLSPNCTLSKSKLIFGGNEVTLNKVSSGVRITCNGETGTLSQLKEIFKFITGCPLLKFGHQKLEKIQFPDIDLHLDDLQMQPDNIKIGCTTGTWEEFCQILDEAKKLDKC